MEALCSFQTQVNVFRTTLRYISEDSPLHSNLCEKIKVQQIHRFLKRKQSFPVWLIILPMTYSYINKENSPLIRTVLMAVLGVLWHLVSRLRKFNRKRSVCWGILNLRFCSKCNTNISTCVRLGRMVISVSSGGIINLMTRRALRKANVDRERPRTQVGRTCETFRRTCHRGRWLKQQSF
jgi:hypothetical protein